MFRRRPPPWHPKPPVQQPIPPQPSSGLPDWAHGFCYLARQSQLHFGQDRRDPVAWRPVVSLVRQGELFQVLPSTRRPKQTFFHLRAEDFFLKRTPSEPPTDSYLCHHYEAIPLDVLREIGVLGHPLRIRIADWLKYRLGT